MLAYVIGRPCRAFMVAFALSCFAACTIATPASAQIYVGQPLGDPDDGSGSICVRPDGSLANTYIGDDCTDNVDNLGFMRFGPTNSDIDLDGYTGRATFNGEAIFNGSAMFNGTVGFAGSLTANGITSTGGLTNTGMFTNNGSAKITGSLDVGSGLTVTGGITTTGTAMIGGNLSALGNATIGGTLTVSGNASFLAPVTMQTLTISNGLAITNGATVDMGGNRVQNVGTPIAATDAANKAYVDAVAGNSSNTGQSTAAALGGGATYDPATGNISAPNYTVGTTNYDNVGSALNAANTTGLAYFHANTSMPDGAATGINSIAIGSSHASGASSTAIGMNSTASGTGSFAAGNGAVASASGAVAVGQSAQATGTNAIAIGTNARATGSVAVGAGATASNGGAAFGDRSVATGINSTALGPDASATADNAVAIGSGSTATTANTVSLGSSTNQRRLVNVAAGVASSDAATVGQLQTSGASVAAALGGGATVRADGSLTAPSYSVAGVNYDNVGSALNGVVSLSYDIRTEARRGIAATTAMATAPMPSEPGRTSWVANTAIFRGELGFGGSIAHRFDTKVPLAITAGFGYAKGGNSIGRVGMAGEF